MKKVLSHATIVSIFLLLLISNTSARALLANQDTGDNPGTKPNELTNLQGDDFSYLMGLEECGDIGKDEGCEKRRIVAEAHLDYIYTQHQRP